MIQSTADTAIPGATPAQFRPIDTAALLPSPALRWLYRPLQPAVEAWFGFPELWRLYAECARPGQSGPEFARAVLHRLGVTWSVVEADLAPLLAHRGPLVVLANHAHGGLDPLGLILLLEMLRPGGWRLFSNRVMCSLPELGRSLIAVDPLGRSAESQRENQLGLLAAGRHLQAGGVVAAFPGRRVAARDAKLGAPCDLPWNGHLVRLAAKTGAAIACFHFAGENSATFRRVPLAWPRLRALMLARELAHPPVSRIEPRLASWQTPAEARRLAASPCGAARLRAQCFLRADADVPRPAILSRTDNGHVAVADPQPREKLEMEVVALREHGRLLVSPDGAVEVLLFQGREAPLLLRELGRCREITFRAAGQGTGLACDVAAEDDYYHHLVLWDGTAGEIVGAYRLGFVREILAEQGPSGLYLDHIFRFRPDFYRTMEGAIELSRSFVVPSRQRDNQALALLWRGLGATAQRHGRSVLFGSVTISNAHHPATRAILVEHLRRNHADDPAFCRMVEARRPFHPATTYHPLIGEAFLGEPIEALAPMVHRLEAGQRGIPPLMRYYCALGARYLGFHVEPSFQDALYCLLRVDLSSIPAGYRRKFMGDSPVSAAS